MEQGRRCHADVPFNPLYKGHPPLAYHRCARLEGRLFHYRRAVVSILLNDSINSQLYTFLVYKFFLRSE